MDFDRLQRIFGRMLETHGMIFAAALAAVVLLVLLVAISRRRRADPKPAKAKKDKKLKAKKGEGAAIDGTTDLILDDDVSMTIEIDEIDETDGDDIELTPMAPDMSDMPDVGDMADMEAVAPDQLNPAMAEQFAHLDDDTPGNMGGDMSDLDDITIPKVGEAPPPQKSRFFSASWLGREKTPAPPPSGGLATAEITFTPEDAKTRASAAECARLADIERKMLALRELYEAGLIAPEVYVLKARELSHQV